MTLNRSTLLGLAMGVAAAAIGGGWQVATRAATTVTQIAPADLVLLRYGIPALVLAPLLWRMGLVPKGVSFRGVVLIWIGAGLPFGLLAMLGTRFAPPAHMGVLMAGASPLIAGTLSWLIWRERPSGSRAIGLALMTAAVLLLGAKSIVNWSSETWRGDLLFVAAATLWAVYALVFRRLGLTPWQAAALVNGWSALAVVAWSALRWMQGDGLGLATLPMADLAWQALWQGLLAGVLGLWTYSVAIARLGAAQAAAFGALAPVVSALGGWIWLGDALTTVDGVAVAAAGCGVAFASGAFAAKGDGPRPGSQERR
jgi:drug/metabolite transporter (DMT)-like permease